MICSILMLFNSKKVFGTKHEWQNDKEEKHENFDTVK